MILLRPAVFHSGTSGAGVADAPLASDNDNPAAPKTGTAFLLFRLEDRLGSDMAGASLACGTTSQSMQPRPRASSK
jgi:hypothetical protein